MTDSEIIAVTVSWTGDIAKQIDEAAQEFADDRTGNLTQSIKGNRARGARRTQSVHPAPEFLDRVTDILRDSDLDALEGYEVLSVTSVDIEVESNGYLGVRVQEEVVEEQDED